MDLNSAFRQIATGTNGGMMERIRVVVADDEAAARTRLLDRLKKQPDIEIAGVAREASEAVRLVCNEAPQLIFLGIRSPGLDGFEVLRQVSAEHIPLTIFVSGDKKFASQAFEVHAFDYLLKPIGDERLELALQRVREHIRTQTAARLSLRLARLIESPGESGKGARYLERIAIKSRGSVTFLDVRDIDWIEAEGVYVNFHVGSKVYLYRATVGQLQKRLDPKQFVRVHRSTIVNTDRILELRPKTHGGYSIILKDKKEELTMSRGWRRQLEDWLRQSLL